MRKLRTFLVTRPASGLLQDLRRRPRRRAASRCAAGARGRARGARARARPEERGSGRVSGIGGAPSAPGGQREGEPGREQGHEDEDSAHADALGQAEDEAVVAPPGTVPVARSEPVRRRPRPGSRDRRHGRGRGAAGGHARTASCRRRAAGASSPRGGAGCRSRQHVVDVLGEHLRASDSAGRRPWPGARATMSSTIGGQARRRPWTARADPCVRHAGEDRRARTGASNARMPVSIRYSTAPSENRSLRASSGSPVACSGDMYDGVPKNSPALVSCAAGTLAIPKSMSLGSPAREHHDVGGLDVAVDDAGGRGRGAGRRPGGRPGAGPRATPIRPSRGSRSARVSPSRYSRAMYRVSLPASRPTSCTTTIPGWFRPGGHARLGQEALLEGRALVLGDGQERGSPS